MPAERFGTVEKVGRSWRVRWWDSDGQRRAKSGFESKQEGRAFLLAKVGEDEKRRRRGGSRFGEQITLGQLADEFLAQHIAEPNTITTLTARLKYARTPFGDTRLDRLAVTELRAWRRTLPEKSAWGIVKALRQLLNYAVAVGLLDESPASAIPNPAPKRREIPVFASLAEVEAVAAEL